jgi:hypothetical protein
MAEGRSIADPEANGLLSTGKTEVDMNDLALFASNMGWDLPVPPSPIEMLAKRFSDAAREDIRVDKKTKRPYRAALSIRKTLPDGKQLHLWIDTDTERRRPSLWRKH